MFGDWWSALVGMEKVFWGISIIFSVLFVIQFVFSLIGIDLDTDVDMDGGGGDVGGIDGDFTILSVRSFIAFFTFFGWAGVGVLNSGGSTILAIGVGAAAGFAAMFIVGYVMYLFTKLQDEGSVMQIESAIHNVGQVYLTIPPEKSGRGKVQVAVSGVLKEMDAVTESGTALPTGASVMVIDVIDDTLLLVESVEREKVLLTK